ncbi:MAG TPA: amidohydrolase family protein [Bryobacteraceae bacterium]|nr:amidohydrolase family protein [Bryobacteraceae bacterium]
MQRRTFLAAAAAASAAGRAYTTTPRYIIDTHLHFYDPSRPQGVPWPAKTEKILYRTVLPEEFRKLTRSFAITGAIVVEASPWLEDNQWILDLAAREPIIVGTVGHLECGRPEFRAHLARFHRNPLFRGIRLNGKGVSEGLQQPAYLDDLKRLADAGLELDAIGDPSMLVGLVRLTDRIPRLRIVINHLPFDWPGDPAARGAAQTALRELARLSQLMGSAAS